MIYLVHGDDVSKSRALIVNQQKKLNANGKIELQITDISPSQLYEHVATTGLFGDVPFIVLDVTEATRMNVDEYITALKKAKDKATIIVYCAKPLSKSNSFVKFATENDVKTLESTKVADANIFRFVEALYSKNRTETYKQLYKLIDEDYEPFYVFSMILYGLRNMAKVLFKAPTTSKMKSFQLDKINSQLRNFSERKILALFQTFALLEKRSKKGSFDIEMLTTVAVEKVLNS